MLQTFTIPDELIGSPQELPPISIVPYYSPGTAVRNQVLFTQNVISFLANGQKEIHQEASPVSFSQDQFAILTSSRCLMTEISSLGDYKSVLFFFSDAMLQQLKAKFKGIWSSTAERTDTLVLDYDNFLHHFRDSLELLHQNPALSMAIKQVKLEELFLYLAEKHPEKLAPLLANVNSSPDLEFRQIVENNKFAHLKVEELAFLCHMSVSTFKRHFQRIYACAPHQWMLQERMKKAGWLLKQQLAPNSIYAQIGYDSYPNFARAFKQYFQLSPRAYQEMNQLVK
mgnify:CR=1 FL=1